MSSPLWADPIPLVIASAGGNTGAIEIAFVNNMPDSAFEATEQQFIDLLERASAEIGDTRWSSADTGFPASSARPPSSSASPSTTARLEEIYGPRPDGLIVTGTEPLADDLRKEPYWEPLAGLITWAEQATASAVVSCLAAHAAALLFDDIERQHAAREVLGRPRSTRSPPITRSPRASAGSSASPTRASTTCLRTSCEAGGYANLIESPGGTWTVAVKERGRLPLRARPGPSRVLDDQPAAGVPPGPAAFPPRRAWRAPAIPAGYVDGREPCAPRALRGSSTRPARSAPSS